MIRTVTTLAKNVAGTAYSAARHPVGTAAHAVGFAKGIVGAGLGLVHHGDVPQQRAATPDAQPTPETAEAEPTQSSQSENQRETQPATEPERELPGPDIVLKPVPSIDDLPEPIVITAEDAPAPGTGEAFQTEPKPTTRPDTVGHEAEDLIEAEDEVVLPDEPDIEVETAVATTGADFGTNPSTGDPDHTT